MEWITNLKIGEITEDLTQGGALNKAKDLIKKWGSENNLECKIHNCSAVNSNKSKGRYLVITTSTRRWYAYQLIISKATEIVGKEYIGEFLGHPLYNDIYGDMKYFARLVKVYNLSCIDASNIEILSEVK